MGKAEEARRGPGRDGGPPWKRLLGLVEERHAEILERERGNGRLAYLYDAGAYWVAFERSAWRLCRLFPQAEVLVLHLRGRPFPVVLAAVAEQAVRPRLRGRDAGRRGGRAALPAPPCPESLYGEWRRKVVDG